MTGGGGRRVRVVTHLNVGVDDGCLKTLRVSAEIAWWTLPLGFGNFDAKWSSIS
jgi:hypothetical protein